MTALPRIALVGAGSMGGLHARVLAQSPRCELAAVIDPEEQTGSKVAERWSVPYRPELGSLDDCDAVVCASPTDVHRELALEILAAGRPLLVEKPVCADLADAEEVVAAAERAGLPVMCGLVERYNPAVLTALALVREPVHVNALRHSPHVPRIPTGVGWDLLVHDVDLTIRCFGTEPEQVSGQLGFFHPDSQADAEDVAEAGLRFPGGLLASVSASRMGHHKIRSMTVFEVDRMVEVDLLRRSVTIFRHVSNDVLDGDGRGYRQQTVMEIPELVTAAEPLASQLGRFCDLLAGSADFDAERRTILPPHRVVNQVLASH